MGQLAGETGGITGKEAVLHASTAFSADWDDDETILSVINELNFGHCAPKSK